MHIYLHIYVPTSVIVGHGINFSHRLARSFPNTKTPRRTLRGVLTTVESLQHTATHCNTLQHTATHPESIWCGQTFQKKWKEAHVIGQNSQKPTRHSSAIYIELNLIFENFHQHSTSNMRSASGRKFSKVNFRVVLYSIYFELHALE